MEMDLRNGAGSVRDGIRTIGDGIDKSRFGRKLRKTTKSSSLEPMSYQHGLSISESIVTDMEIVAERDREKRNKDVYQLVDDGRCRDFLRLVCNHRVSDLINDQEGDFKIHDSKEKISNEVDESNDKGRKNDPDSETDPHNPTPPAKMGLIRRLEKKVEGASMSFGAAVTQKIL
ncbi:hypothetical protein HAX54_011919 [Datura stramonium]|uniref:Uncharacterized protein n=1 Tax=Datura stramonium TaxID=4076 RepID=A0ABS8TKR7_DATST|nr:hypothetical protein [Datura stramonium]